MSDIKFNPPVGFIQATRDLHPAPQGPHVGSVSMPYQRGGAPMRYTPEQLGAPNVEQVEPSTPLDITQMGAARITNGSAWAIVVESSANVSTTQSALILTTPQGRRNMLAFRNTSATANIYLGFGSAATTNNVFRITPNGMMLFDTVVPQDDIYVIADAVSATLSFAYSNITP